MFLSDSVPDIQLRDIVESDLPIFFEQQLDRAANHMAGAREMRLRYRG